MSLKFGTDGVRGIANRELTPELALNLGRAAARVLGGSRWLIGQDTRRSGPLLVAALSAGLATEGVEVVDLGVVPTPGVAYLSSADHVPAAMVSASHNAYGDNGIKLFTAGGSKLSDELEARLELELTALSTQADPRPRPAGAEVGTIVVDHEAIDRYRRHLVEGVVGPRALAGLKVVLDGANGAAAELAAGVFEELGATVLALHVEPDGVNINEACGSTHPEGLQAAVVAHGADVGLAFDGDQIIAICAIDRHERGRLADGTVVVTVMSNLGFHQGMAAHGIKVITTDVGDRYVLEALDEGKLCLGGEQSGHVIFRDLASTGDGMLTGIALLSVMARRGRTLADLAADAMVRLPQVLVNVRTAHRDPGLLGRLQPEVDVAEDQLGERGRVLLRASGTEPVIRVRVEAPTHDEAAELAGHLAASVTALSR